MCSAALNLARLSLPLIHSRMAAECRWEYAFLFKKNKAKDEKGAENKL